MKERGKTRISGGLLATLCVIGAVGALWAQAATADPGQLDPAFGKGGRAVTALDFGDPKYWYSVKVQAARTPEGKILVSGNETLLRYTADGRLDRTFAQGGVLRIERAEGYAFVLSGLAVDPQGRIVVAGTRRSDWTQDLSPRAAILRFTPSGAPDPTFGGGDGAVVTDLGLPPPLNSTVPGGILAVSGVAVDKMGRIVVSGSRLEASAYCYVYGGFVARLSQQGSADPSFGIGGVVNYEPTSLSSADGITLDGSGAPVFFDINSPCRGDTITYTVDRLDANGAPDAAFGQAGRVVIKGRPRQVAVDRFGRTVVMEAQSLLRLLPSGAPDRSFGNGGVTGSRFREKWSAPDDLVLTGNGSALVTGHLAHYVKAPEPRRWLALVRLGPNGMLDRDFGRAGIVRTRFGGFSDTVGRQVLLDGKGHAIVAGTVSDEELRTGEGLALYRYDLR